MNYKKALFATDLRWKSFSAADQAVHVAQCLGIEDLTALYVIENRKFLSKVFYQEEEHLAYCKLSELASFSHIRNYLIEEGDARKVVLEFINEHDIDLLFINAHCHSGFDRLGSVGYALVNQAPCPVWLLPYGKEGS
ncbi:universal stress protein [Piscirickettsia litoralis]|nr:universal stress protein [Piscirickettsia litoralis]